MVNSTSPKISKTTAIQLIDEQIDEFLNLSTSGLLTDYTKKYGYESAISKLRQAVMLICQLTSEDDALNFIESIVPIVTAESYYDSFIAIDLYKSIKDLFIVNTTRYEHIFANYIIPSLHWRDIHIFVIGAISPEIVIHHKHFNIAKK